METAKKKTSLYGMLCDTGIVEVTASCGYEKVSGMLTGKIELRVEVWTAAAFGSRQQRGHCFEVFLDGPEDYENAYKAILGTYIDYWKKEGAIVDPMWKDKLAYACGRTFAKFMREVYACIPAPTDLMSLN